MADRKPETIRERTEQHERRLLSEYACLSEDSTRDRPEEPCTVRTKFQQDRDRIIHSKAYRRLTHKTQVFLSPEGDHYRTRMTHTLEVAQIARTIARALRLNEDLAEAISLGHDLGHTPFGHAGERSLDRVSPHGYRHFEQSVRIVERLEKDGLGLNLTREVRNGILCHTSGEDADTLEGRVVRFADKIAYTNHDIDDAVRAGVLEPGDIPWEIQYRLGRGKSERISTLILAVVESSEGKNEITMEPEIYEIYLQLMEFMFDAVYTNPVAKSEEGKAEDLIERMYRHYIVNPELLPQEYRLIVAEEGVDRAVSDYISGMSDRFAITNYHELFIPKSWE